jgi:hypothetical protein
MFAILAQKNWEYKGKNDQELWKYKTNNYRCDKIDKKKRPGNQVFSSTQCGPYSDFG